MPIVQQLPQQPAQPDPMDAIMQALNQLNTDCRDMFTRQNQQIAALQNVVNNIGNQHQPQQQQQQPMIMQPNVAARQEASQASQPPNYEKMADHMRDTWTTYRKLSARDRHDIQFVLAMWDERHHMSQQGVEKLRSKLQLYYIVHTKDWKTALANDPDAAEVGLKLKDPPQPIVVYNRGGQYTQARRYYSGGNDDIWYGSYSRGRSRRDSIDLARSKSRDRSNSSSRSSRYGRSGRH